MQKLSAIAMFLAISLPATLTGQTTAANPAATEIKKGETHVNHAKGPFDVKMTPAPAAENSDKSADTGIGRMLIDKQFHGDLEAHSVGAMLSNFGTVKGSAGYVAMERVTGTLDGRSGSFVLQHSATMDRGAPSMNVTVVPDSGTGGLEGISGTMQIIIEGGKHSYDFAYTLPAKP